MPADIQSVVGYLSGAWALWGVTLSVVALSAQPRIQDANGYTSSALIIALSMASFGFLFNVLSWYLAEKVAAVKALKWIEFLLYLFAWGLVLVQLSYAAQRPFATENQTATFWYAAYGDVFYGVAWLSILLDLICSKPKAAPAEHHEHAGEDVQIVPVGGAQPTKSSGGWGTFWFFALGIPPAAGLVVFAAIRGWDHKYALALDSNILFTASILSCILLWHLAVLYFWKVYSVHSYHSADVYAEGALLAAVIGALLTATNDLTLTVVIAYALYGATAVVFARLATTPATRYLLFIKN